MIIEIKDLPNEHIKTIDVHIDFEKKPEGEVQVKTEPSAGEKHETGIPAEMQNGDF